MSISLTRFLTCLSFLMILGPCGASAQSAEKPVQSTSDSEQTLRDILGELRQLRSQLLRVSVDANRSQLLLARVRVEQDQTARLTRAISDIHNQITEIRNVRPRKKAQIEEFEKLVADGLMPEPELKEIKRQAGELDQQEAALQEQESLLSAQLTAAEAILADLNVRLDQIDQEMVKAAANAHAATKQPQKSDDRDH